MQPLDAFNAGFDEAHEAAIRQSSAASGLQSPEPESGDVPRLKTLTAEELLRLELKPREYALAPILPFPGLAMIYAARGLGKTYVALSVSHAIASGGRALRWDAPRPLRVLHIDGEMPAPALQERLAQVVAGSGVALPDENRLRFVIGDLAQTRLMTGAGSSLGLCGCAGLGSWSSSSTTRARAGISAVQAAGRMRLILSSLYAAPKTTTLKKARGLNCISKRRAARWVPLWRLLRRG
jgi:hypothetical protein